MEIPVRGAIERSSGPRYRAAQPSRTFPSTFLPIRRQSSEKRPGDRCGRPARNDGSAAEADATARSSFLFSGDLCQKTIVTSQRR